MPGVLLLGLVSFVALSVPNASVRRRVMNLQAGTYIGDILADQDSALYRWPDRPGMQIRVYVEPTSSVAGWSPRYADMAREVFTEWARMDAPLSFTFIDDTASADIAVSWVDRFPVEDGQRIGLTERLQSSRYEITRARISVANHDSLDRLLTPGVVAGIVRHEVGHALGLNHSADASSVMYRESATSTLSASDRATLRLLYLVPPGSLK
ncbi:MAG TPA: matrixin family metalloprotease [Gemmatimonadaceae bacterium]